MAGDWWSDEVSEKVVPYVESAQQYVAAIDLIEMALLDFKAQAAKGANFSGMRSRLEDAPSCTPEDNYARLVRAVIAAVRSTGRTLSK